MEKIVRVDGIPWDWEANRESSLRILQRYRFQDWTCSADSRDKAVAFVSECIAQEVSG